MTTTASTSTSQPPPASGPTEDIDNYIHGYSAHESRRLADQADTLSDLLHHDTAYPAGAKVLEVGCGVGTQTVHLVAVPARTARVGAGSCGEPRGAVPGPGHRRPAPHRDGRRRRHVPYTFFKTVGHRERSSPGTADGLPVGDGTLPQNSASMTFTSSHPSRN
ncbi:hypothetical protein [Streptomyces sp. DSM 40750]|uniref:hypothetical protein n=1 Tax=Streptomyces sp. DSM 40750 TaxID=2801030 RepID=UPI00214B6E66|nr:hypothetical protein [Streptomyces sp. DSM 40750]UUU24461.1 hypothetical protein JIX55_31735 [Streptomyces sp. DSM 40750]